jgi:hypothetical protein
LFDCGFDRVHVLGCHHAHFAHNDVVLDRSEDACDNRRAHEAAYLPVDDEMISNEKRVSYPARDRGNDDFLAASVIGVSA